MGRLVVSNRVADLDPKERLMQESLRWHSLLRGENIAPCGLAVTCFPEM